MICRKKHYFSIVLQFTQEDQDEIIIWIDQRACLHKYINFVKKNNCLSMMSKTKDMR